MVADALHRLLVASVVDYAIYGLTVDGRVATWNAGAERLKGYSAAEIIGRHVSEFYPPEARGDDGRAARAMRLLEEAVRSGRAEDEEWRVRRDGSRFWANVIVTPVRDEQEHLLGFAKVTRDLTERRAAEERARELAAEQAARAAAERNEAQLRAFTELLQEQALELEAQTEEAQVLTEDLEQTNEQLMQVTAQTDAARRRAESLQRVTAALAQAHTMADVGEVFSRELTTLVDADTAWVGVVARDGSAVEALGWAGYPVGASSHWKRLPLDTGVSLTDVVRTGRAQWWMTREELIAAYPAREGVIRTAAQESVAVLPLLGNDAAEGDAAGKAIGGLVIGFRSPREFDADTRAFFVALAQQCAQAVARARAFEAERIARVEADAARLRAEQLQMLTAALARAVTAEAVVDAAVVEGGRAVGSASGALALLDDDGKMFTLVPGPGMPGDVAEAWHRFPNEGHGSVAEAVRTLTPAYSRTRAEFAARSPELAALAERLQLGADAALPLVIAAGTPRQRVLGILAFIFAEARDFDSADDAFLRAVADQCAQALERARLFQAEQTARAEAEAANQIKAQFLATMSHELRTPLNAIGGHAELLELGIHGPVSAEQLSALNRIQRSQKHLLALINEVLNYARLEAGAVQYDIRDVDVATVLASVESVMLPQIQAKGLRLSVSQAAPDLVVRADPEKVEQVLLNLLSNSVKFTGPGGTIMMVCRPCDGEPTGAYPGQGSSRADVHEPRGFVEIAVSDTGVGVPPDQIDRIFEPFVQVGRTLKSPIEGTGLGLAISRDLAIAMGGDLKVESAVGKGSTFTVTLRRASGDTR